MKKIVMLALAVAMLSAVIAGCAAPAPAPAAAPAAAQVPADEAVPAADDTDVPDDAADVSLERVKEKGSIVLGLDDAFPPMGYRDENNEIVGFDIDMAKAVAEKMGLELKLQPVIWDNIALEINNRNVDIIWNGCTITDERKEVFDFSKPYMLNDQVVVVLKDSEFNSLEDLSGKICGLQAGSSANEALDNHPEFKDTLSEVVPYEANDRALLDLAAKRVDCVVVDTTVFGYYFGLKPDTYRKLDASLGSEEYGIAFHQGDDAFREALQSALDEVMDSDIGEEISNKWFGSSVFPEE